MNELHNLLSQLGVDGYFHLTEREDGSTYAMSKWLMMNMKKDEVSDAWLVHNLEFFPFGQDHQCITGRGTLRSDGINVDFGSNFEFSPLIACQQCDDPLPPCFLQLLHIRGFNITPQLAF